MGAASQGSPDHYVLRIYREGVVPAPAFGLTLTARNPEVSVLKPPRSPFPGLLLRDAAKHEFELYCVGVRFEQVNAFEFGTVSICSDGNKRT
jgi:hypothetical protein